MIRGNGVLCQISIPPMGNFIPSLARITMLMPHPLFFEAVQLACTSSICFFLIFAYRQKHEWPKYDLAIGEADISVPKSK